MKMRFVVSLVMALSTPVNLVVAEQGALSAQPNKGAKRLGGEDYLLTYRASDLTGTEYVQTLYKRIKRTANKHCARYVQAPSIKVAKNCVSSLVEDILSKIDHRDLDQYRATI